MTLVATGTLTIARARASRGATIALPPRINYPLIAPLRSVRHHRTEFSDYSWGRTTRGYVKMARALSGAEFEALVEEAVELARDHNGAAGVPDATGEDEDPRACIFDDLESDEESEDPRACLVDNDTTDSDEESDVCLVCLGAGTDSEEESGLCPYCLGDSTDSDEECKTFFSRPSNNLTFVVFQNLHCTTLLHAYTTLIPTPSSVYYMFASSQGYTQLLAVIPRSTWPTSTCYFFYSLCCSLNFSNRYNT